MFIHQYTELAKTKIGFWATITSNYATGPLSCLSVTSVYCGQMVGSICHLVWR